MVKALTFKQWCDEHRKALKRWYRQRDESQAEIAFKDWAQQFYKLYLEDLHPIR